ncbi:MAG: hypothetical protein GY832_06730 [Chloroflexi bacterium]|nr:hypothetical protein [Chloroflexota bacterium]
MEPLTVEHKLLTATFTDRVSLPVGAPWSPKRSSLAYHHAFDLCAVEINRLGGTAAIFASGVFYARELARRLTRGTALWFTREWELDGAIRSAMGPEVDWGQVSLNSTRDGDKHSYPSVIVWAEPEVQTWKSILSDIHQLAPSAARLYVLGTTRLRRLLPEWGQATSLPALEPLNSSRAVARALSRRGWIVEQMVGFHGPLSLLSGAVSRLPAALGRDDLVDRCFAALRQTYIVRGWQTKWVPVWMLVAKRG